MRSVRPQEIASRKTIFEVPSGGDPPGLAHQAAPVVRQRHQGTQGLPLRIEVVQEARRIRQGSRDLEAPPGFEGPPGPGVRPQWFQDALPALKVRGLDLRSAQSLPQSHALGHILGQMGKSYKGPRLGALGTSLEVGLHGTHDGVSRNAPAIPLHQLGKVLPAQEGGPPMQVVRPFSLDPVQFFPRVGHHEGF